MTNKEKLERIKYFADKQDVIGILGSFLIDDAYKDVEFAKFIKQTDPQLFYGIHPIIMNQLEQNQKVMESCIFILENEKLSINTKAQIANASKELAEKCKAVACAAKELCEVFDKANQ